MKNLGNKVYHNLITEREILESTIRSGGQLVGRNIDYIFPIKLNRDESRLRNKTDYGDYI